MLSEQKMVQRIQVQEYDEGNNKQDRKRRRW
jgi:hypothetical protein